MTLRAVLDAPYQPLVRLSARVGTVAQMLDDKPSQIRRMLARGDLEGHREGKRGVRIYLDSVEAWQRKNPVGGTLVAQKKAPPPRLGTLAPATKAAHRAAMAHLHRLGLV